MIDREKVVDALRNCINKPKCLDCPWEECSYDHEDLTLPKGLVMDAYDLLKNPSVAMDRSATVKELAKPKLKITCTEYEKDWILGAISTNKTCGLQNIKCQNYKTCRECLEKNIEWTITDN